MNVAFGRRKVAVAGKIPERVGIHVRGPAGQARVPEGIEREARDLGDCVCFCVRFLERRFFDVLTLGEGRERPSCFRKISPTAFR